MGGRKGSSHCSFSQHQVSILLQSPGLLASKYTSSSTHVPSGITHVYCMQQCFLVCIVTFFVLYARIVCIFECIARITILGIWRYDGKCESAVINWSVLVLVTHDVAHVSPRVGDVTFLFGSTSPARGWWNSQTQPLRTPAYYIVASTNCFEE